MSLFTGKGNKIETSSQHLVQGADMISMDGFDCGGHPGRCTRTQPAWPVPGHPNPIQLDFRPLHQKNV